MTFDCNGILPFLNCLYKNRWLPNLSLLRIQRDLIFVGYSRTGYCISTTCADCTLVPKSLHSVCSQSFSKSSSRAVTRSCGWMFPLSRLTLSPGMLDPVTRPRNWTNSGAEDGHDAEKRPKDRSSTTRQTCSGPMLNAKHPEVIATRLTPNGKPSLKTASSIVKQRIKYSQ